jgi:hypothetical protein
VRDSPSLPRTDTGGKGLGLGLSILLAVLAAIVVVFVAVHVTGLMPHDVRSQVGS